jgi:LysR family transcriptional regulator, transcriptional activator of nhaA
MPALNFKHLRYFWMVAKSGSIIRASEQLHLSPQSISGQLAELESTLGIQLFRRVGRGLEMTEMGRHIYGYAEEIFALGNELMDAVQSQSTKKTIPFRIGIADSVPKTVAHRVIEPVMHIDGSIRLMCREGKLSALLAEMAIHHLDMVIADRPMPSTLNIRAYSHLLGESPLCILGAKSIIASLSTEAFPKNLDQAPFLLPGEDVAIHSHLLQWFESQHIYPRIVGEFDDSALMKLFGQTGAGFFVSPAAMSAYVQERYQVVEVGRIDSIQEQLYAITAERRMTHPAALAVAETTKKVFAA